MYDKIKEAVNHLEEFLENPDPAEAYDKLLALRGRLKDALASHPDHPKDEATDDQPNK